MGNSIDQKTRLEIGANLKKIREGKVLTQSDISHEAGVNLNYYARIERGEVNFSIDIFRKIVKALSIKASEVLPF